MERRLDSMRKLMDLEQRLAIEEIPKCHTVKLRVHLQFDVRGPNFTIRGLDDRSRQWLDTTPELIGIMRDLRGMLHGRMIMQDGMRVASDNPLFRSRPVTTAETPRSVAFLLGGLLYRRFRETRFEVAPL